METERIAILKMLEAGQIDAVEAARLLSAIKEPGEATPPEERIDVEVPTSAPDSLERQKSRWTRFWIYPFMAGVSVLILGALVMALVYSTDAARGWLVCGWLPLILGLLVTVLVWWSRQAKWLHIRIREGGKRKLALSFPLPLTFAAWVLRIAQPFVPQLRETGADDLIIALRDSGYDEPISIDVNDEEEGEQVQLYIG